MDTMPLLTDTSLDELVAAVEAHYATHGLAGPIVWAYHYGSEDSYLLSSRYTQLFGAAVSGPWPNGRGPTVREQLTKLLSESQAARAAGRERDIVIVIEREARGLGDGWEYAASIDEDARKCEDRVRATPRRVHQNAVDAELRHEDALRAMAMDSTRQPALLECLECGASYTEPGHVEPGGMGCNRCG